MKVYRSHGYSSWLSSSLTPSRPTPSSASAFFSPCASLIPLLHPLSPNLSSHSLPRFCHPITPGLFSFSNFLPQWSWRQLLSPCLSYLSFSSIYFLPSYQNNQFKFKFECPFLNVSNANMLTQLRICFYLASNFALLPALPPSSTDLHGLRSARIRQQLPGDSFSWLRVCNR